MNRWSELLSSLDFVDYEFGTKEEPKARDDVATCRQVHGIDVSILPNLAEDADALITNIPGTKVGIITADCVPVLLVDVTAKVVAAIHTGWRGAAGGILENCVAHMEKLSCKGESMRAVVGPCIQKQVYEVGEDVRTAFLEKNAKNSCFFEERPRSAAFFFDLPGYVCGLLRQLGVGRIESMGLCTYSSPHMFFSYRRSFQEGLERSPGHQLSFIGLKA